MAAIIRRNAAAVLVAAFFTSIDIAPGVLIGGLTPLSVYAMVTQSCIAAINLAYTVFLRGSALWIVDQLNKYVRPSIRLA